MNFLERELKKSEKNGSKERAFALSFEKIEEELNSWIQRDKYSNEIINEIIDNLRKCENSLGDNFLQVVDYTLKALEKIVDSPKKSLVKISEFQDINKVTTTDFKTMTWLGSKPGKNLAEKIGVKGKVLAPKNVYTIDKKENRIVTYYVKKVLEMLELRFLSYNNIGNEAKKFQEIYKRFYRLKRKMISNKMYYLNRPLDFIPNNTLIDHRDYSVVNRGLNILKKYIKESEYTEQELLEKSLLIIFVNILAGLKEMKNIKVVKKIFDIKNTLSLKEDSVEYFIEGKNFYNLKIKLETERLIISLKKLAFNEKNKKVIEDKVLLNNQIELEISKGYDLENNLLKFTIFVFPEEMVLNGENLKTVADDVIEDIVKIVGEKEIEEKISILEKDEKGVYIDLNTPLSFLNNNILEDCVYSKKLNSFVGAKDYYTIEELTSISNIFYTGEKLEYISKYLDKIFEESLGIKEKKISIFSSPENQDSEVQKDIYTIFNSKFKASYPIWRSILATYALDDEIGVQEENIILDLNVMIPSVNIVKKYGTIFEHYPLLIEDSDELKEFSLEIFIERYLNEYLKKYNIKINSKDKDNILRSRKLNSILFFNKERVFINISENFFYIDRDLEIFNNIVSSMERKLFDNLKEKSYKLNLNNKKVVIISDYISDVEKNITVIKEKQLGEGKNRILERILSKKSVWNEFLPNLSLQTIKAGHFYNLELIKDKSINLTLGEEIIFEVKDTLVFPAGQKIITFPLYSEDSLNKKSYLLEVKSSSFPLDEPLEVKLKIGYSYGKKNPYRIIVYTDDNQVEFETKWVEYREEIGKKQINFPDIVIDEKDGEFILDRIWKAKRIYEKTKDCTRLAECLNNYKNRFRKYLIKKVENRQANEILDHLSICYLRSLLDSSELDEKLEYPLKLFLSSFNNITSIEIDSESYHIEKRKFLFNYSQGDLRLKSFIVNGRTFKAIGTIAELAWLDRYFIKGVSEKEPKVLVQCLAQVKKDLNDIRKNFDEKYNRAYEKGKIWEFRDSIRNSLEFLLALFLLDKDKNILFNEMKNRREYSELIYNLKEIDRKIQLETIKYPDLKKEFDNGLRIKIDIGEREGLENVSDLVYTLFNYMTGSDGSELIKIKEVVEK